MGDRQKEVGRPMDKDDDALYRLVVDNAEDYAIFVMDAARRVVIWNRGAELLLGYSAEEMIGRSGDLIFTPEDIAAGAPALEVQKALAEGKASDNRPHVRKDGSRFWASGVVTRLDDGLGGVRGLAKILRDQTSLLLAREERDQAEAALRVSEQRFRRLIEANIIGVGISSASGEWIDANDALLLILGRSREDLRAGKVRWDEMTPDEYRELDLRGIEQANRRGACSPYEKEYVRADGSRVPILIGYATVSGVKGHYVCFVLDLSPQKRVEQALRDADRGKDEFLAMLAHELRNPLSAIANASRVMTRSNDPDHWEWAKGVVEKQVGSLARMIDDLLDVSRITRGKIELRKEPLEILRVVDQAVETARPLISARRHQLAIPNRPASLWVEADPQRLEQVIVNLLNNAAKYTDPGGKITLSIRAEEKTVAVAVRDNGQGIVPQRIQQMFDLFAQGDRTAARSEGGLGIGLTLVRRLVELHGGTVSATSDGLGKGSEFTVRIPILSTPSPPPPASPSRNVRLGGGLRVLIVDDNRDNAQGLASLLSIDGIEVETAFDGPSGIDAARRFRPDCVLLDIGLPIMDGYEVARRLRREGFADASIIAVSGYGDEAARIRSREAGFDHHLIKPIDYDQLLGILQNQNRAGRTLNLDLPSRNQST